MEYVSTSALAKELKIKSSELFKNFETTGLIEKKNNQWVLTDLGKAKGGITKVSPKFGEFIVWPKNSTNIPKVESEEVPKSSTLNATKIANHFGISSQKLNLILSELGWMKKSISGWEVTKEGKRIGGKQLEHYQSGGTYVLWPGEILENRNLKSVFTDEPDMTEQEPSPASKEVNSFREKFPPKFRTKDGHMVRSRGEVIIDDALYYYKVVHAYERRLPIEEDLYCDFFIPSESVYIEYWGMENDPKYAERKKKKLEIYKKYEYNLIELTDDDIANIDDNLPRKLLKHNIKVY